MNKVKEIMNKFNESKSKINIRDIKSSYIIKTLFLFLNEKKRLNMIIYSKEINTEYIFS